MSEAVQDKIQDITDIAKGLNNSEKNIILIYAFNATGKTRLSIAFKDLNKANNAGNHVGVYYNAYSEDLFYWENDEENSGENIRLQVKKSTLNKFHSLLDENNLKEKLSQYKPKYGFSFSYFDDPSQGIESIGFFLKNEEDKEGEKTKIKISRGEERVFVWCFFLALFEVEGWADKQSGYFFIDDPVSSLDDHNIFVTAVSLMDLIDNHFKDRKIIITTHHVGLFATLFDWLCKGEKASSYKSSVQMNILKSEGDSVQLVSHKRDVFLYHLHLLQTLNDTKKKNEYYAFHFALLRQIFENVSSFLGVGRLSFVLEQIGFEDPDEVARIINILSHKNVFIYEMKEMVEDNKVLFIEIFDKLMEKYQFRI